MVPEIIPFVTEVITLEVMRWAQAKSLITVKRGLALRAARNMRQGQLKVVARHATESRACRVRD